MFKLPKTPSLILCIVVLCLEALPTGCSQAPSRTLADYLRCEYRVDPVGIGVTTPRLSWIVTAPPGARGVKQTAYRILVSSSPDKLANDQGDFWDSGKVNSNASAQITYSGLPLSARAQSWWKVKLWDENNREGDWSQPANFSVGLLTATDWQARWIGFDAPSDSSLSPEVETRLLNQKWAVAPPAVDSKSPHTAIFQRAFNLPAGAKLAKLAFHLGPDQICTVSVNGTVVGTAYRWLPAEEINATQAVRPGKNMAQLAVTQEDGYSPAVDGEMMLQIDGKPAQYLPVDASWQVSWSSAEKAEQGAAALKSQPANLVDHTPWGTPVSSFHRLTPASYLRKDFTVEKTVRRATVYSTALGVYEFHLNGHKVGEDVLTPGWTQFPRRVYYQAYDVTPLVHPGENTAGIILGDGWFASALSFTGKRNFYGSPPRTKAQLEIEYTDGTRQVIATDESWTASTGPLRYSDIWLGCAYDATRELAGWDDPNPTGTWKSVAVGLASTSSAPAIDEAKMKVEATPSDSARVLEHLPTQTVTEPQPHVYVFDLGQNIVGWAHLHLAGKAGQRLTVRYGEMLNPDGMVYTSNLRGAMATDVFTLKDGDQSLEPIFTFHGFRYVEILGLDANPGAGAVEGEVVHSDMPEAGDFTCSDPTVNQLVRNIQRGQKGNYFYIPTDCPQRDERLGWTGDTQFFIRTGTYNFDTAGFFTNWLVTMCEDSQSENGAFADVAPDALGASGATAWGDAALTCTYTIYRVYGDTRVIDDHWAALKRYMDFLASKTDDRGISTVGGFGDWLNKGGGASAPVIDTAYHVYLASIMAEMARATGREDEAIAFQKLHDQLRDDFIKAFLQPDGTIKDSSQTGYALAFTMDLVPDNLRTKMADQFVNDLKNRGWHLATGFIGTPRLLPALHLARRDDIAYRILLQDTYPSWLFQVKLGATTMWERWDGWTPEHGFQDIGMNSFNHYAFGSVGEYLYRFVAGIDTDGPGYRKIIIAPQPEQGLDWAKAHYDSINGRVVSEWKRDASSFSLDVQVPPNTTALVRIPAVSNSTVTEGDSPAESADGVRLDHRDNDAVYYEIGSGTYSFHVQ